MYSVRYYLILKNPISKNDNMGITYLRRKIKCMLLGYKL